ncbi:MAG: hypothetical protein M3Z16_07020 [Pseudomonadota bacterium]|nr:hypothetical protein [Pseudomonadota bacterium]
MNAFSSLVKDRVARSVLRARRRPPGCEYHFAPIYKKFTEETMIRSLLCTGILTAASVVLPAQAAESVGQAASSAATNTGHAIGNAGRKTGHAVASAGRKTGHAVAETGRKVKRKTKAASRSASSTY